MTTHHLTAEQLHIPAVPRSVALGLFDGLHPGHRQVIVAAVENAADAWTPAVFTFLPHTVIKDGYRRLTDDREEEHLLKEIGDCFWMLAELCTVDGYTLGEVGRMNIDKLRARYPEGFDTEHSIHRKANDI